LDGGVFGHHQDPPRRLGAFLGIDHLLNFDHVAAAFQDPVFPGDRRVQDPFLHVVGHLLRPDDGAGQMRIVHRGKIVSGAGFDHPSRLGEKIGGGLLQAPLGNPELELIHRKPPWGRRLSLP
jgi:hypothetical protein